MISEIERFHSAVKGSPELNQGLESASNPDDLVAFAGSNGYNFSVEDLEQWGGLKKGQLRGEDELSDADLENAAGGVGGYLGAVIGITESMARAAYNDIKRLLT